MGVLCFRPWGIQGYLPNQVQQPMCLHKTSWRDLGADLPTVPPILNSHFTRTALYLPAPGIQNWECDRQPRRCFHLAQWGYEPRRADHSTGMPSWDTDFQVKRPACLARCTLVVRWSNACWTGHNHADGSKSSLLAQCWFAHSGQMPARRDIAMQMVNSCAVE